MQDPFKKQFASYIILIGLSSGLEDVNARATCASRVQMLRSSHSRKWAARVRTLALSTQGT